MTELSSKTKPISVIIPTYKDHQSLAKCIQCLKNQTINEHFEIIIVDNDPSSNDMHFNNEKNISVIKEKKRGSYSARNTGIKYAQKGILAFTDSDCRPDPDWLKNAVNKIRDGSSIVAGQTCVIESKDPSLAEIYEKCFAFDFKYYMQLNRAPTANLIVNSSMFESVGYFSEVSMSTGDMEWSLRASKAGYKIDFCSNVLVFHPARKTFSEIFKKMRRVTIGNLEHGFISRKKNIIEIMKSLIPSRHSLKVLVNGEAKLSWRLIAFIISYFLKLYSLYIQYKYKLK